MRLPLRFAALALALLCRGLTGADWDDPDAGRPILHVWQANDYGMSEANWCIARDHRGKLYAGNDKVLEFDGRTWTSINVGNGYAVRALAVDDLNRIWVGAINEIGYLEEQPDGTRRYQSLAPHLPEDLVIGDVWGVHRLRDRTLFVTEDAVLVWDERAFEVVRMPNESRLFSFPYRQGVAISQHGTACWYWDGTTFAPMNLGGAEQELIAFIIPLKEETELLDPAKELAQLQGHEIRLLETNGARYLQGAGTTAALRLPDGNICVATFLKGLVILRPDGTLARVIDRADGLPSLNCIGLYLDDHQGLWVATSSAIVRMDVRNLGSAFGDRDGIDSGPVHLVGSGAKVVYAFSSETVSVHQRSDEPWRRSFFASVDGLHDFFWDVLAPTSHGDIFGGRRSLVTLHEGTAKELLAGADPFFRLIGWQKHRAIVAEDTRIGIVEFNGSVIRGPVLIDSLPEPAADLAIDESENLWAVLPRHGVYSVSLATTPPGDVAGFLPSPDFADAASNPRLFTLNGRTHVYNSHEIHRLRRGREPTSTHLLRGYGLVAAEQNGEADLWAIGIRGDNPPQLVRITGDNHSLRIEPFAFRDFSAAGKVRSISRGPRSGELWIGGTSGVIRIRLDAVAPAPPLRAPTILRSHWRTPNGPSVIPGASLNELPFEANSSLSFNVRPGDDILFPSHVIQTRLAGFESSWTDTTGERKFTGLREGNYTFEARAVDFHGQTGPISRVSVVIRPPWHRSGWAITGYLLLAVGVIWGAVALRTRRVARLNAQLERLVSVRTGELTRAVAARSAFLANMGHEIRNPLNGVVGLVELLRSRELEKPQRETVDRLGNCAHQLVSVVEDVLEFSKVDAGQITLRMEAFTLGDPVEAAVDIFRAAMPDAPIAVEAASDALASRIIGDPDRIRQVLINYLANALKFGGDGQVTLRLEHHGESLTFSVSDEGPGIPRDEQDRLFVRFTRGSRAHRHGIPGTGLGLAACKAYADAMGGEVWVESEAGRGATFFLRLPFHAATDGDTTSTVVSPDIMVGRKALVVDDHDFNRIIMADMLGRMGATAKCVGDVDAAREAFVEEVPDIVFVDFDLAGATGVDLANWIRAEAPFARDVPVVATSAFEVDEVRRRCEEAGMDGFLAKPITPQKIIGIMSRIEAIRAGDAPSEFTTPSASRPKTSFLDVLSDGDPDRRAELLVSGWREILLEALDALRGLRRGDLPGASQNAHRLVSAALMLGLGDVVAAGRRLDATAKAGDPLAAARAARDLRSAVRNARRNYDR